MKFDFPLKLALFGFLMLTVSIYGFTGCISIGSFKFLAFILGAIFFPAGVRLVIRSLKRSRERRELQKR